MTHSRAPRPPVPAVALLVAICLVTLGACGDGAGPLSRARSGRRPESTTTATTAPTAPPPADGGGLPAGWEPDPLTWGKCRTDGIDQCATLKVPLDWSAPDGTQIDLALGRQRATGSQPVGSLLTNPGGPGGSGLEFIAGGGPFADELTRRFDIVSWDPRGVGESTAVTCGDRVSEFLAEDPSPDTPAEQDAIDGAADAVAQECAAEDADLLAHIGTADVARDLEAIRRALGGEPLNYMGFSYGTAIGLRYAQMFGQNIRAMVLDGVVDPSQGFEDFLLGQAKAFDASFEENIRRCTAAGESVCGVADLGAAYDEVAAAVERERLPGGPKGVGPAELATAATFTAYLNDGWSELGAALADARKGDGAALWDLAQQYYDFGGYGAYAGVTCTDTPHPEGDAAYRAFAERAAQVSPRFGPSVANEMLPCATWPVAPTGTPGAVTAPDAPPILVIGNTGDPATPLANAEAVAGSLSRGHLVVVDSDGHTAYGLNDCIDAAVHAYLISLRVPAEGTKC